MFTLEEYVCDYVKKRKETGTKTVKKFKHKTFNCQKNTHRKISYIKHIHIHTNLNLLLFEVFVIYWISMLNYFYYL